MRVGGHIRKVRLTGNEKVVFNSGLEHGPRHKIWVSINSFMPQLLKQQRQERSHHQSDPRFGRSLSPHSKQKQSILQHSGKEVTKPTIATNKKCGGCLIEIKMCGELTRCGLIVVASQQEGSEIKLWESLKKSDSWESLQVLKFKDVEFVYTTTGPLTRRPVTPVHYFAQTKWTLNRLQDEYTSSPFFPPRSTPSSTSLSSRPSASFPSSGPSTSSSRIKRKLTLQITPSSSSHLPSSSSSMKSIASSPGAKKTSFYQSISNPSPAFT